jgi:hypothetical protein
MEANVAVRSVLEIGLGVIYMFTAGFNITYTLKYGEKLYMTFAEGTWFSPARWFIPKFVISKPRMLTIPLILVQLFAGIAILSRGPYVGIGLLVGVIFCMYAVFVSSFHGAIANLAMAVLQFYLASIR